MSLAKTFRCSLYWLCSFISTAFLEYCPPLNQLRIYRVIFLIKIKTSTPKKDTQKNEQPPENHTLKIGTPFQIKKKITPVLANGSLGSGQDLRGIRWLKWAQGVEGERFPWVCARGFCRDKCRRQPLAKPLRVEQRCQTRKARHEPGGWPGGNTRRLPYCRRPINQHFSLSLPRPAGEHNRGQWTSFFHLAAAGYFFIYLKKLEENCREEYHSPDEQSKKQGWSASDTCFALVFLRRDVRARNKRTPYYLLGDEFGEERSARFG